MPTPQFIVDLRQHIGHAPLWLSGVTVVVIREATQEVLLVKPSLDVPWNPVTGILEPGEHPIAAAEREVLEETGVACLAQRVAAVGVSGQVVHPNGDRAQYLNLTIRADWVSGEPAPADDELVAAQWFALSDRPPIRPQYENWFMAAAHEPLDAPCRWFEPA